MTITARYAGTCGACGRLIAPGDLIEWTKGEKPRHTGCRRTGTGTRVRADRIVVNGHGRARGDGRCNMCRQFVHSGELHFCEED